MVKDLFDWDKSNSYVLLNEHDESRKTPGLFLVGPQVRHEDLILCFIYKYRQRFGVVANAIGNKLGMDTLFLEQYRNEGLYLDDLGACGEECPCWLEIIENLNSISVCYGYAKLLLVLLG